MNELHRSNYTAFREPPGSNRVKWTRERKPVFTSAIWIFTTPQAGPVEGQHGYPAVQGHGIDRTSGCGKSTFLRCLNRMNDTISGTHSKGRSCLKTRIYIPRLQRGGTPPAGWDGVPETESFPNRSTITWLSARGTWTGGKQGAARWNCGESLRDAVLWTRLKMI